MSPTAKAITKRYEALIAKHSQGIEELNLSAWTACKKLLGYHKSYECKHDAKLARSIENFILLLEDSDGSAYRRLELVEWLIKAEVLLSPIRFLTVESRTELEDISGATMAHYKNNSVPLPK